MAKSGNKTAEEVFEQVQELDSQEREKLIALLDAVTETNFIAPPAIEQAWLDEAGRRREMRLSGKTQTRPGEEVFAVLRRKYVE
jgi:hypothetical protein